MMTTTTAYETATAVPAVPLTRREESQRLQLQREAFRAEQRRIDDEHWAEQEEKARARKDARRAGRARERAKSRRAALGWLGAHTVDLLFVPVIVVPGALAWDAMAAYGRSVWGPLGFAMPLFSEGAMWAFSAAVAIRRRKDTDAPVWHLQLGVLIFAAYGAVLNFLHGMSPTTAHHGLVVALSMAVVSVAGVTAHQLVAAGPRQSRAEKELARFRRAAGRRQALARKASVARALVDVDEEGHADLVYEPGLYELRRGIAGPRLAAPRKGRALPALERPARTPARAVREALHEEPAPESGMRADVPARAAAEAPQAAAVRASGPVRAVPQATFAAPAARDGNVPGEEDGDDGTAPLADWPQPAVAERIAVEMREAAAAGRPWRPDYDQLKALTGKQLRWCQKAVSIARDLARQPGHDDPETSRESSQSSRGEAPQGRRAEGGPRLRRVAPPESEAS